MSTPEQKCIGLPEQKYISGAGKKVFELGAVVRSSVPFRSRIVCSRAGFSGITRYFVYFFRSGTTLSATRFPPMIEPTRRSAPT